MWWADAALMLKKSVTDQPAACRSREQGRHPRRDSGCACIIFYAQYFARSFVVEPPNCSDLGIFEILGGFSAVSRTFAGRVAFFMI
jgi:hypothetical protein